MNNESRTLWISLGSGLFAAFLLYSYSQEKKAEYDKTYGTMKNVVVAKANIEEMRTIDDTMLEVVQKPADFMEPGAIQDPDLAVGQVAGKAIKKGEQILDSKLLLPGPDTGISLQVAPSKRAVTLPIDEVRGVAKLIRPGDRVDIYAAIDTGKGFTQKREVSMLMQDVVVLATGIKVVNSLPVSVEPDGSGKNAILTNLSNDTKYSSLTIEATPKEAQDLIYIISTSPSNIYFTLRNPNDRTVPPRLPSSTSDSVLGRPTISLESSPQTTVVSPIQIPQQRRQNVVPTLPKKKGPFKNF
ncbi:MAG: Flp pilus assembly protein CpaB [Bdellovibrio sp. CG10_big_fil_rev_8_21_14_0_10_47_8]|nr:MAG: Flp pilus assembly protein CpaB [Bdellovibrio sp. CG10_big_fil_rev_8_21_14_0_10_47_8]